MFPRSPNGGDRACYMLRRKSSTADATKMLDEIDRRREWAAMQFALPHSGHRKPRAFDRERHRNAIPDDVSHRRIGHRCPVGFPVAAVVQNAANNQEIAKVRDVGELKEVVYPG